MITFGGVLVVLSYAFQRSHDQLRQEKLQLNTLVESLAEGVVILNRSGRIVQCNAQAKAILDLPRPN